MKIKGYNSIDINGNTFVFKGEGIKLMGRIEEVLTNVAILPEKKHLVILDLLNKTERHVLHEAYDLYDEHIKNPDSIITDRDRVATAKVMHLVARVLG